MFKDFGSVWNGCAIWCRARVCNIEVGTGVQHGVAEKVRAAIVQPVIVVCMYSLSLCALSKRPSLFEHDEAWTALKSADRATGGADE